MAIKRKQPSKLQTEYKRERQNFLRRLKRAELKGYEFPDNIIPEIPKRVTKRSIKELKDLTGNEIRKKSLQRTIQKGSDIGQIVSSNIGIEIEKEELRLSRLKNLSYAKARKEVTKSIDEKAKVLPFDVGKQLFETYEKIFQQEGAIPATRFLSTLTSDEYEYFHSYRDYIEGGRYERKSDYPNEIGGQAIQNLYEDERIEPEETAVEDEGYYIDEERESEITDRKSEIITDDEEIKDPRFSEWLAEYEKTKEKRRRKKPIKVADEGDSVYYNILDILSKFDYYFTSLPVDQQSRRYTNKASRISLENLLQDTILKEGFNTVMRRLQDKAYEISVVLEVMLYDSDPKNVQLAYSQLAEIIKGKALTVEESLYYTSVGESASYDDEFDEEFEE